MSNKNLSLILLMLLAVLILGLWATFGAGPTIAAATTPAAQAAPLASASSVSCLPLVQSLKEPTAPQPTVPAPTSTPVAFDPQVETVLGGLSIPWALDWDTAGNLYYTERPGSLSVLRVGATEPELLADLEVVTRGEGGLLGLVLDPAFEQNGHLYLMYTYVGAASNLNRISRFTLSNGTVISESILIDAIPGAPNHDGGRLAIGPDGKLYATTGDARNLDLPQDPTSLAGKVLRLNLDGSVPVDNPTPGSYIYSLGHRNPQGLDWQPGTGALWEAEHGPSGEFGQCCQDEVNRIVPLGNYGWPIVTTGSDDSRFMPPIAHSGVNNTWAPSGIAFYDGELLAPWQGHLFVVALRGRQLVHITLGGPQRDQVLNIESLYLDKYGRIRDVRVGPDGALYFTTSNRDGRGQPIAEDDRILRIVNGG